MNIYKLTNSNHWTSSIHILGWQATSATTGVGLHANRCEILEGNQCELLDGHDAYGHDKCGLRQQKATGLLIEICMPSEVLHDPAQNSWSAPSWKYQ